VKLFEHNRIQLVWVPGHMKIDKNEIADKFARQCSSHTFIGPKPAFGISTEVARRVIRDQMNGKHNEYGQSIHGQR
jgi:ribonuclease HI